VIGQVCNRCGIEKPVGSFPAKTLRCRTCTHDIWAENRKAEGKDPAEMRRKQKQKKRYGITPTQFNQMLADQDSVCAICKKPEKKQINGRTASLCVDHDHGSGVIRGLLCRNCNTAIGLLGEDLTVIGRALAYVATHKGITTAVEQPQNTSEQAPAPMPTPPPTTAL
jgi:hypothetical protein